MITIIAVMMEAVLLIIISVLINYNNTYNDSYNDCDNLTIMIITMKIIIETIHVIFIKK